MYYHQVDLVLSLIMSCRFLLFFRHDAPGMYAAHTTVLGLAEQRAHEGRQDPFPVYADVHTPVALPAASFLQLFTSGQQVPPHTLLAEQHCPLMHVCVTPQQDCTQQLEHMSSGTRQHCS